jgi:hypothetical protein
MHNLVEYDAIASVASNRRVISKAYRTGSYWIEVYDNPSVNLAPQLQDQLIQECMPVVQNGFVEQNIDEEVVRRHIFRTSTSIIIRNKYRCIIGVAGSSIIDIDEYKIIYLQGATILKEYRDYGLHKLTLAIRLFEDAKKVGKELIENRKLLVGGRTQNPLVYKFFHRNLDLFPSPNGYIDEKIKDTANKFSIKIRENYSDFKFSYGSYFNTNTFVINNSLGRLLDGREDGLNLYGKNIPFCKNDNEINSYMKNNLDWENGDALIMLGYYEKKNVMSLFRNKNPELDLFYPCELANT